MTIKYQFSYVKDDYVYSFTTSRKTPPTIAKGFFLAYLKSRCEELDINTIITITITTFNSRNIKTVEEHNVKCGIVMNYINSIDYMQDDFWQVECLEEEE